MTSGTVAASHYEIILRDLARGDHTKLVNADMKKKNSEKNRQNKLKSAETGKSKSVEKSDKHLVNVSLHNDDIRTGISRQVPNSVIRIPGGSPLRQCL